MTRLTEGAQVDPLVVKSAQGAAITIPDGERITHLQFRRFAGCPMCNLHLRTFVHRHSELRERGIQEIAVFHSPAAAILEHNSSAPFALIADPEMSLYRRFGVERSLSAVLDPRAWLPAIRGVLNFGVSLPGAGETPLGLPGDFLIGPDGRLLALKYGLHAYDHWTVDEMLALATSRA